MGVGFGIFVGFRGGAKYAKGLSQTKIIKWQKGFDFFCTFAIPIILC